MSVRLSAKQIAERALRRIGAFSINDLAADTAELTETLYHLDLVVAELIGTEQCTWMSAGTITMPTVAAQAEYGLNSATGWPDDDVAFPSYAWIRDASGNDAPLDMMRRDEYEALADKDTEGQPTHIYIDRAIDTPTATLYPVPADATMTIGVVVQRMAPSMVGESSARTNAVAHGFPMEWQRWMVLATAAEIGSGPVRRLPQGEINDLRAASLDAKTRLMARANRENTRTRRTAAWGV